MYICVICTYSTTYCMHECINSKSCMQGATCITRVCVCVCICAHVNAASDATEDCACIAGYTGPNGGTCTACEEGKFKDSPGPAACSTCPGNSTSPAGLCGLFV